MKIKTLMAFIAAAIMLPAICAEPELPEQFAGKKVKVYKGTTFKSFKGVIQPEDADSVFGKAVALPGNAGTIARNGGINFGVWDVARKRPLCAFRLLVDKLVQDEKYHIYRVGKIIMKNNTPYFYGSCSWVLQVNVGDMYKADGTPKDNTYEVYVSAKVTGPTYVKNSTQKDMLYIDAVYFVQ